MVSVCFSLLPSSTATSLSVPVSQDPLNPFPDPPLPSSPARAVPTTTQLVLPLHGSSPPRRGERASPCTARSRSRQRAACPAAWRATGFARYSSVGERDCRPSGQLARVRRGRFGGLGRVRCRLGKWLLDVFEGRRLDWRCWGFVSGLVMICRELT